MPLREVCTEHVRRLGKTRRAGPRKGPGEAQVQAKTPAPYGGRLAGASLDDFVVEQNRLAMPSLAGASGYHCSATALPNDRVSDMTRDLEPPITRRAVLACCGAGFGFLALADLLHRDGL